MSIRRHFRIRSLQFLYAQHLSKMDSKKVEKNMLKSIESLHHMYIFLLYLILKIRENAINFNNKTAIIQKFAYNSVIKILSKNKYLIEEYHSTKNSVKILWNQQDKYIFMLLQEMQKKPNFCKKYYKESYSSFDSFEEEKTFLIKYYKNFFIPNKKLVEYIEDLYYINGEEDLYIAHTMVCKTLQFINLSTPKNFKLYNIYKNNENKKFIISLYRNTIFHKDEFNNLINNTSNNWDIKRIAIIDLIILQMAICEFLYFPNIPPKATMNEYIEITKIFCMEKSKIFINGILDNIFKFLYKKNKIFKIGKGLM
ncbi:transcription antitermination factor NusB [Blattabacterium sp. (Blaberus giganteus)]|uniref:transcription antitermination factor NusB n=1 Tax=Blattabacterium sp. (Blaberus giganteus) TaxID=1186051 RepID=UPI00025F6FB6|nr:transcription antitermination factor NusB [Blattabacterium sp. (Blaberus giganteus)]AFJ90866.1 transcription antitermination factor NusB [Blattabacterium sp. (Blaberus giganteus)]